MIGCALVSIFIPCILVVYNMLGGVVVTLMSFFLPMMMFWKSEKALKEKIGVTVLALVLTGLGVLSAGYEIYIL